MTNEKQHLDDIKEALKDDYYYDNPGAAIEDMKWLIKLVENLNTK